MNYLEHHLGDYAKRALSFSMLEHGAYSVLRDRYFTKEEPIPVADVYRVASARSRDERAAVDAVLAEFYRLDVDVWRCDLFDAQLEVARNKIVAAQENGKKGGRPKKKNPEQTEHKPSGFSVGSISETQVKAHQSPDTNPSISSAPPTGASEKRPHAPGRPDGVDPQVWADWLQLRKAKKAPVTDTVLTSAKGEAVKAGMSLDAFLRVWCARGSQGLQADWLRPNERAQGNSPSDDRASRAAKAKQLLGISAQPSPQGDFIDG